MAAFDATQLSLRFQVWGRVPASAVEPAKLVLVAAAASAADAIGLMSSHAQLQRAQLGGSTFASSTPPLLRFNAYEVRDRDLPQPEPPVAVFSLLGFTTAPAAGKP